MKHIHLFLFLAAGMLCGTLAAKPAFERPPVVFFNNGNISGYVGHDVRVRLKTAVEKSDNALKFDGNRSVCRFSIPWLYPDMPLSASYVVDCVIDRLPERGGVITGRPGYHNALALRADGKVTFSCFSRDGKSSRQLVSKTALVPGRRYRLAGTLDCSRNNKTEMKLVIDGVVEAKDTLPAPPWRYGRELFLGGVDADRDGNSKHPVACTVENFYFYYRSLSVSDICNLPGEAGKQCLPVLRPAADLKASPELHGNITKENGAFVFPGNGYAAWKTQSVPESVTMTAAVKLDRLPEKSGVILARPGFDSALGIAPDGRVFLSVWNDSRTDSLMIFSKTKIEPGREYRLTGVAEGRTVETIVTLYVDGRQECRDAITGRIFPYSGEFFAGGIPDGKGGVRSGLACRLSDCRIFGIALPPEAAAKLQ